MKPMNTKHSLIALAKPEPKQVKVPRTAGRMRFTKCGTFRGFKYD